MQTEIRIKSKVESVNLYLDRGNVKRAGQIIRKCGPFSKTVVLTNNKIKKLHWNNLEKSLSKSKIDYHLISIPDGERYKNFETYQKIIHKLAKLKIDRHSLLIAFGGGVIGDLGGYVAATYKRGIALGHIPTTLIAQIDASIGGKTAIDLPEGKNLVGAFYNPKFILTDPDLLETLTIRQFKNGLFEAIKIGLVHNEKLYRYISENSVKLLKRDKTVIKKMVEMSAMEKITIVQKDPYERNLRMILNFGHTLGHALEKESGYKSLLHGEAVGYGMLFSIRVGNNLGLSNIDQQSDIYIQIELLIGNKKLPVFDSDRLWQCIRLDKKSNRDNIKFVIVQKIGCHKIINLTRDEFIRAINQL